METLGSKTWASILTIDPIHTFRASGIPLYTGQLDICRSWGPTRTYTDHGHIDLLYIGPDSRRALHEGLRSKDRNDMARTHNRHIVGN